MTVQQQVDALTASVDNLKGAVVSKTATLDASVTDAQSATAQAQAAKVTALSARDQAGTFKDAAYRAAQSAASGVAYQDLSAVALTKAVTAVDVFIYDTSKDSDGGAWRHRCAGTSWYREELNTYNRGSRREFPAVAVIVADESFVTIYDGDDPSHPLWMRFVLGSNNFIYTGPTTAVAMFNGILAVGVAGSGGGLCLVGFPQDKSLVSLDYSSNNFAIRGVGIAGRNGGGSRVLGANRQYLSGIVNRAVNDVAMTVLPNAPIDPASKLPLATIAVATAGGVSIITDRGEVHHLSYYSMGHANHVSFFGSLLYFTYGTTATTSGNPMVIDVANLSTDRTDVNGANLAYVMGHVYGFNSPSIWPAFKDNGARAAVLLSSNSLARGCTGALTLMHFGDVPGAKSDGSMVAYIAANYTTGWMPGDTKGAWLADTDDSDLVASGELVANGTFDVDTTGWTVLDATASVISGAVRVTSTAAYGRLSQVVPTEAGNTYCVTVDLIGGSASSGSVITGGTYTTKSVGSKLVHYFKATGSNTTVSIQVQSADVGQYVDFDNVSVKLADADRSVNNKGLVINGTVTREPVSQGAELVAYSGFSAANYFEQNYTGAFDFGTGDFSVMAWVKTTGSGSFALLQISDRLGVSYGTNHMVFWALGTSGELRVRFGVGANSMSRNIPFTFGDAVWRHVAFVRRNGVLNTYVNGMSVDSVAASSFDFSFGADYFLNVGPYWFNGVFSGGTAAHLALLRVSSTAPANDQIRQIYRDERPLFQENAACTLYGSVDVTRAIAHDPDTGLLHVGTTEGRSVFKGLSRVAHSTSAVTTAIAASGDLVVQQ
ncbi:LamG-like jellyroll fold domain-containing protein [Shimia sp. FJ5]|uniref:LamG-like jellyroll fold domain-containing protein n=1 Tax=Shimia sp. FJ5 TaxID=3079054 RepID=UPI00293DC8A5|nr:LamG-like jellyroll fold domain-containing protein [Shimia sp. FJ5]MDV4144373.1 LamG-like jellyroll fold domain-containing protein [Shimia sp. FJ5]